MNTYYITKPGIMEPMGPMSIEDIRVGIQQGVIDHEWTYTKIGMKKWLPIYALNALLQRIPHSYNDQFVTNANGTIGVHNNHFANMVTPKPPRPNSGLLAGILLTLFFTPFIIPAILCLPAIIMSLRCNSLYNKGKYKAARQAAKSAFTYRLFILCMTLLVLTFICIRLNF